MAREISWDGHGKWCGHGRESREFKRLAVKHQCGRVHKGRRVADSDCGRFTCTKCLRTLPWCYGSADDLSPTWCDDCWSEKYGKEAV